jgi:NAD(P)-dependent dehydrogenase (short-subunit alcohol dehydrogenase family)
VLLENKNAVIYGGGGAIGGAVAQTFAREGASVFLAGRTPDPLQAVAERIARAGGSVEIAQVDALDEQAVRRHADAIAERAGRIDVCLNAIGIPEVQGIPLVEISLEEFAVPITLWTRTQLLTSSAAAKHMLRRRSGVILTLTGPAGRIAQPLSAGFGVACAAIEALTRGLAAELGPHGIRVVCLQPGGMPETPNVRQSFAEHAAGAGMTLEQFQASLEERTLLRRMPTLTEVADVAAFMASERASAMTATIANLTCGSIAD